MGAIKRYAKPLCTILPLFGWWYSTWAKRYGSHPEKYPLKKRYKCLHNAFVKMTKYLNVDVYFEGLENIPKDINVCFVGNHIGDYDPIALSTGLEKPTAFVGKIEILKFGLIPTAMKAVESAFIDRGDLKQTFRTMKRVQSQMETQKKNWVIFPEGTRRKDSRLNIAEFHAGTFRTPMKAKIAIMPFALVGTDRIFKTSPVYKRYPVHVKFLKPIMPEDYEGKETNTIAKYCQNEIQRTISFDLRRKDHAIMTKMYGKKYKPI